jgi:replicative DNA helicase
MNADAITEAIQQCRPEYLSNEKLRTLYSVIVSLYERGIEVDIPVLTDELRKKNRLQDIGAPFVFEVARQVAAWQNIGHYCTRVREHWQLKRLKEISGEIENQIAQPLVDAGELLDKVETQLVAIRDSSLQPTTAPVKDGLQQFESELEERGKTGKLPGILTGLRSLDRTTGGMRKKKLIVVAARPGMGKSALALTICKNLAEQSPPVSSLIISLEMSRDELIERLMCQETGYTVYDFRESERIASIDWPKVNIALNRLYSDEIYIDDAPTHTLLEIRAIARKWKRQANIGLLVIDYMQLIHTRGRTRNEEVAEISRDLKRLSKELDIPVMAISQLSRKTEERADKRPCMADLRESGNIEQDADEIWFVYRPWTAGTQEIDGRSTEGLAIIIVEKNRGGATGDIETYFDAPRFAFRDL